MPEPDWERRLHDAGCRPEAHIACPYPDGTISEDGLPIDIALDDRERGGDFDAYETALHTIIDDEPGDVDAYAHLGHLYWNMSHPDGERIAFATPPTDGQRERWLATPLDFYLAGVAVGELPPPEPFCGTLHRSNLDNRPFPARHARSRADSVAAAPLPGG